MNIRMNRVKHKSTLFEKIFWTIFCLVALFMIVAVLDIGWVLTSIDYSHGLSDIVDTIWNGTNAN